MVPGTTLRQRTLPLMNTKAALNAVKAPASSVQSGTQAALIANLACTFLVAGPLSSILGSVNQLQVLVHIFLLNLAYPATATVFFGDLMQVLTF